MENLDQIVEAIVFASGNKIDKRDLLKKLPIEVSRKDLNKSIRHLAKRYSGKSGIIFNVMDNEIEFTSNADYGDIVADVLKITKEKELSKVLLEVLSIIAYKGPITKTQIEDIRNTNSEYAVSTLCRYNLIYPCGRADTLGRPMLYKTTTEFLEKFGLKSLKELPGKEEVLSRLNDLKEQNSNDSLFKEVDTDNLDDILVDDDDLDEAIDRARQDFVDTYMNTEEIPDFLDDEDGDIQVVGDDDDDDEEDSFFGDDDDEEDDSIDDDDCIVETAGSLDDDDEDDFVDEVVETDDDTYYDSDGEGSLYH